MRKRSTRIFAIASAALILTSCQTTRLSGNDLATVCLALEKTRVMPKREELAHLSEDTIKMIKANPAVRRELGC